ncbi:hypothetical protein C5167_022727, partial [Papaver somniferum]
METVEDQARTKPHAVPIIPVGSTTILSSFSLLGSKFLPFSIGREGKFRVAVAGPDMGASDRD